MFDYRKLTELCEFLREKGMFNGFLESRAIGTTEETSRDRIEFMRKQELRVCVQIGNSIRKLLYLGLRYDCVTMQHLKQSWHDI